jgi:hypothetical protein
MFVMLRKLFLLLVLVSLTISSCKKEKEEEETKAEEKDTSYAQDNSIAQKYFDDMYDVVRKSASSKQDSTQSNLCATITLDVSVSPAILIIDFGTDGCKGNDARVRRGKITTTISGGYYRDIGTVLISTPENYYVDNHKVEGKKTVTNLGRNANNNLQFSVKVENAKITEPSGDKTIEWNSVRTNEWIEGESTRFNPFDDVYLVTGTASGKNRNDKKFDIEITKDLRVQWCGDPIYRVLITEGILEIKPETKIDQLIDYGDGSCNNEAIATILGVNYKFNF